MIDDINLADLLLFKKLPVLIGLRMLLLGLACAPSRDALSWSSSLFALSWCHLSTAG